MVMYTQFYKDNMNFLDFYVWVGLTNIFCSISMVTVLVCCVCIMYKLYLASVKRRRMTSKVIGYDVRVVRMLVTVCVIYICVQAPMIAMYSNSRPGFLVKSSVDQLFCDGCDILCAVNTSANFIVYVTMSRKYAKTYRYLFLSQCCTSKQH
jgi:hypothetical protein